jgi:hypothetical protein
VSNGWFRPASVSRIHVSSIQRAQVSHSHTIVRHPNLPDIDRCSRGFSFALDTQSHIWIFQSWGRPYKFCSPLLQNPNDPVVQIAGGWDNGACLTQSGKVFVFWPKSGFHHERCKKKDDELDFVNPHPNNLGILNEQERYIQCYPWGMRGVDPLQLPDLPYADLLPIRPGAPEHFECKLVKIALGGHFIVGLTDGGHVLALDLPNATSYFHPTSCATSWKYVSIEISLITDVMLIGFVFSWYSSAHVEMIPLSKLREYVYISLCRA